MIILLIHNRYQHTGGEDIVFEAEKKILLDGGHKIIEYIRDNREINEYSPLKKLLLFWLTTWSNRSYQEIRQICNQYRPDVAHIHNYTPLITPSAFYACSDASVPIVQTLHNYWLICPGGQFLKSDRICEECLTFGFIRALRYRCYRKSVVQTMAVIRMIKKHQNRNTWNSVVTRYITLTEFSKSKFIEGGLPEEKIAVKPNFIGGIDKSDEDKGYAIFLGRLSREKGVHVLLEAWKNILNVPLKIIGDGPERASLEFEYPLLQNVNFTGILSHDDAINELRKCSFIIVPSLWYETFGLIIIEAYACGKPVIASRIGALEEIVEDGVTGLHFNPGDTADLVSKIQWMIDHPDERNRMGDNARIVYEEKYTPELNYKMLMEIYRPAIENVKRSGEV